MARTYARVFVSIWGDEQFKALTPAAQALYFRLLTDARLSMCGVSDWRPNRLAMSSQGSTTKSIRQAGAELEAARFIIIDEDSEEVLIRTFVKHDGVLKSPNLVKAMVSDWTAIASSKLQRAVVTEVMAATESDPAAKGLGELPDQFKRGSESVPETLNGRVPETLPDQFDLPSHILNQQPTTQNPVDAAQKQRGRTTGTRLPKDWIPDPDVRQQMAEERPDVDLKAEHKKFTDHWQAKSGKDATKVDWNATWRNWIRNARTAPGVRPSQPVPSYAPTPAPDPESLPWKAAV